MYVLKKLFSRLFLIGERVFTAENIACMQYAQYFIFFPQFMFNEQHYQLLAAVKFG